MKKEKNIAKDWSEYYDQRNILDELLEDPVEFSLDDQLLQDILSRKRKRKLQNITIKMDPLQVSTIRKLATIKSIPYQTLIRHWLSDQIRKELNFFNGIARRRMKEVKNAHTQRT
jgi:predicted DNA binding CopG/RHH family protein